MMDAGLLRFFFEKKGLKNFGTSIYRHKIVCNRFVGAL